MAEEIVGTAFVRIRALTKNLGKDIKSSVEKGMKDADLDKVAKEHGDSTGEDFADGFSDSANKNLKKRSKSLFGNVFDDVSKQFKQLNLDDALWEDFANPRRFRQSIKKQTESVDRALRDIGRRQREFGKIATDSFLPFDEGRFTNFFRRFRSGLNESKRDFQNWAGVLRDDLDNDGAISKILDSLSQKFRNLGSTDLPSIGLLRGGLLAIGGAIVAALPYIQDVGAAVLAYATGLVAQVGFLGTALGGLGAAAAAALGSVLVAAGPIALAFASETEVLIEFKDSAKAAGEEFLRIGTATQATLLPALDDALQIITGLTPMFSEFGLFAGRAVGQFANLAAETLTGVTAQERFAAIFRSSLQILDMLMPMLIDVGDILSGLWVASIPAAERFVETLGRVLSGWQEIVNEGLRTGTLERTLTLWYDRAEILGGALADLAGAIWDIFDAGASASSGVFQGFADWAESYREWTSSEVGQNKLALIFENALAVMHEVNGVVADLFDGILGRLGEVGGVDSLVESLQSFREALPGIQEGWAQFYTTTKDIVGAIVDNAWDKFQRAIEELGEPLGRLGTQLLEVLDVMNDSGAFEVFLDLMRILTDVLSALLSIPGFGTFVGYMLAFGSAAKVAGMVLGPFIGVFGKFVSTAIRLGTSGASIALGTTATSLGRFISAFRAAPLAAGAVKNFTGGVAGAAEVVGTGTNNKGLAAGLGAAVKGLTGSSGLVAGLGAAGIAAAAVAGGAWLVAQHRAQQWAQEIRQATDAIGLMNDGLNVLSSDGIAKYIQESSRFESRDQLDDLVRLGFGYEGLAEQVSNAALSYQDFLQSALASNEVTIEASAVSGRVTGGPSREVFTSLEALQKEFNLTREQLDELAKGEAVWVESGEKFKRGANVRVSGNKSILDSFEELIKVLGEGAQESLPDFLVNPQNVRLLGEGVLNDLAKDMKDAKPEEAYVRMGEALNKLNTAAKKSSEGIKGLSDSTRDQIREQATLADGTVDYVRENQLLYDASRKLSTEIRGQLELFNSSEFISEFGTARQAIIDFSLTAGSIDLSNFRNTDGLDVMLSKFPTLGGEFDKLFSALQGLPTDEFNAAARILGYDADQLRDAMNGAAQSMEDLQRTAVENLPSVGKLLDEATSLQEDGTQFFDAAGFSKSVQERIAQTQKFGDNIAFIHEKEGAEAARLAVQQGPEAAAALAEMVAASPGQLQKVIQDMEAADQALQAQIRDVMAPDIALQYASMGNLVGENMSIGIGRGINAPETLEAIKTSSLDTLDALARGVQGHFEWVNGVLKFVHTGTFRTTPRNRRGVRISTGGGGGATLSAGGFVLDKSMFGNGPSGTDTVPAWLTPGEFVLRRAVAQAIPASVLNSLNAGDPRLISLLSTLNRTRPASPASAVASAQVAPSAQGASGSLVIQQMNITAPTPLESARQVSSRLRILQTQHTRR